MSISSTPSSKHPRRENGRRPALPEQKGPRGPSALASIQLIRPKELAKALAVNQSTIWRWARDGTLPPRTMLTKTVGGWTLTGVQQLIEARRQRPGADDE